MVRYHNSGTQRFDDLESDSVNTDDLTVSNVAGKASLGSPQTIPNATVTQFNLTSNDIDDANVTVDTSADKITINTAGTFLILGAVRWSGSSNWSQGDRIFSRIRDLTNSRNLGLQNDGHPGVNLNVDQILYEVIEVGSPPIDIALEVFHQRGGSEEIGKVNRRNKLSVMRIA